MSKSAIRTVVQAVCLMAVLAVLAIPLSNLMVAFRRMLGTGGGRPVAVVESKDEDDGAQDEDESSAE